MGVKEKYDIFIWGYFHNSVKNIVIAFNYLKGA